MGHRNARRRTRSRRCPCADRITRRRGCAISCPICTLNGRGAELGLVVIGARVWRGGAARGCARRIHLVVAAPMRWLGCPRHFCPMERPRLCILDRTTRVGRQRRRRGQRLPRSAPEAQGGPPCSAYRRSGGEDSCAAQLSCSSGAGPRGRLVGALRGGIAAPDVFAEQSFTSTAVGLAIAEGKFTVAIPCEVLSRRGGGPAPTPDARSAICSHGGRPHSVDIASFPYNRRRVSRRSSWRCGHAQTARSSSTTRRELHAHTRRSCKNNRAVGARLSAARLFARSGREPTWEASKRGVDGRFGLYS